MKKINAFMVKGIIKSKYVLWVSLVLIVFILLLYGINTTQSGATKKELQATFYLGTDDSPLRGYRVDLFLWCGTEIYNTHPHSYRLLPIR